MLLIEKGATDWDMGLRKACCGEHKDIALLMIEYRTKNNKITTQSLNLYIYLILLSSNNILFIFFECVEVKHEK